MMKNIFFYFLLSFSLLVVTSCDDGLETSYSTVDLPEKGAVVTYSNVVNGFYDLVNLDDASIGFTLDAVGAEPSNVEVYKSYNGGAVVKHSDVSSLPADLTVTFDEAIDGLSVNKDSVELGDYVVFTFKAATSDGEFFSENALQIDVSCPSDLAGTYTAMTTGASTDPCCPDITNNTTEVTLTDNGGGSYTINDFSAGLYFIWYEVYGITEGMQTDGTLAGSFGELCGELNGVFGEPFSTDVVLTGSVDSETGVITYNWENGYGDNGEVTLTPQ